jgi:hypothetical protein
MTFSWRKEPRFIEEARKLLDFHYQYENEIIFYFGMRLGQNKTQNGEWEKLSIIIRPPTAFPDALLVNFETGEALNVEFERTSLAFKDHIKKLGNKAIDECDLIVCAKHNWVDCPIDVYNVVDDSLYKTKK